MEETAPWGMAVGRSKLITISPNGLRADPRDLLAFVPGPALTLAKANHQKAVPAFARDQLLLQSIEDSVRRLPTTHKLIQGDSRDLDAIPDASVHLVLTSPPYWTLKAYPRRRGQLGAVKDYEAFIAELDKVWRQMLRVLVPGGRMVIVVGDVCLPRRRFGRHVVFPLHSSIQERCRQIGFDNLAPIIWYKIANAQLEVENGSHFLGKPYEPNAIVKNDVEYILFERKPGGYRKPSLAARILSVIPESSQKEWFKQVWSIRGASTRDHPAPFPVPLAERLIRMFSFVGDVVLDPFMGSGTTNVAACLRGRDSIGIDIEPKYFRLAEQRLFETRKQLELPLSVWPPDTTSLNKSRSLAEVPS